MTELEASPGNKADYGIRGLYQVPDQALDRMQPLRCSRREGEARSFARNGLTLESHVSPLGALRHLNPRNDCGESAVSATTLAHSCISTPVQTRRKPEVRKGLPHRLRPCTQGAQSAVCCSRARLLRMPWPGMPRSSTEDPCRRRRQGPAGAQPGPDRDRGALLPGRQPLSVHRLRQDHPVGAERGGRDARGVAARGDRPPRSARRWPGSC